MTAFAPPRPRLFISQDADDGWLTALEFGLVDDGQPAERWTSVGERVRLLYDEDGERCLGFRVSRVRQYDPEAPGYEELWDGPRFDVPALGLTDVPPNAILVATRALFGTATTVNRELFDLGTKAQGEAALRRWLRCLQSGDSMAHYGIGYSLYDLGRHQEAYRHLRHYAELAPYEPWTWAWYGRAAAAIGETVEARSALARAAELDEERETDALELLDELDAGTFMPPVAAPQPGVRTVLGILVEQLVQQIGESLRPVLGDDDVFVLVALDPPVWVHVDPRDGDVTILAQAGSVAATDLHDDELDAMVAEMSTHHPLEFDAESGDIYVALEVPGMLAERDARPVLLRPLVFGAAACARSLPAIAEPYGIEILPPRDAGDEYQDFIDRHDHR